MFRRAVTISFFSSLLFVATLLPQSVLAVCQNLIVQNDTDICSGASISLSVNTLNPVSVLWSTGATTATIQVAPAQTGVYYVTVNDGAETCTDSITLTVLPVYSSTETVSRCQGQTYVLPNGTSVSTAGTYVSNLLTVRGCDSTIITNLTINPTYSIPRTASICQGQSYLLPDGRTVTAAGTYTSTFTTIRGCDSVITTVLTVNRVYNIYRTATICDNQSIVLPGGQVATAAGTYSATLVTVAGCDSTIITTVTVKPTYQFTIFVSLCQGQSYTLPNGQVVNSTGIYPVTFLSSQTCDSTIITDLTVDPVYTINKEDSICQGQQYTLPNGGLVGTAGTYTVTLTSSLGCDSIIITRLRVNPVYTNVPYSASICQGEVHYLPNANTVSVSGTYAVTIPSSKGCDSTVVTTLTVHPVYNVQVDTAICEYEFFILPDGNVADTAGAYPRLLSTVNGCDSLVTIHLSVNPVYSLSQDITICQGQPFVLPGAQTVYDAGMYIDTLATVRSCDSVVTTNLTVNPSYRVTEYYSICQGDTLFLSNGTPVTTAGTYSVSFTSSLSCDSTIITNVSLLPVYTTVFDTTICDGDVYLLADSSQVTFAGSYPVLLQSIRGCDSTVITNLSLRPVYSVDVYDTICLGDVSYLPDGQPAYATGAYPVTLTSSVSCDSVVVTNLTVNPIYNLNRNVTICQGSTYELPDGQIVTAPGTYPVLLPSVDGCDSLIITNITVRLNYTTNRTISICQGDTIALPDGVLVSSSGIYTTNYLTIFGCDSTIRTIVNVRPVYNLVRSASICQGETYLLPGGSVVSTQGVYTHTFQTVYGCDSIIVTTLTVNPTYSISQNVSICQGSPYILPNNTIVYSAGTYQATLSSVNGCDSVVTIQLSVSTTISNTFRPSICQGETYTLPGGQVVGSPGTYYGNYQTTTGCDSSVTIILSVYPNYNFQLVESICQGESYLLPNGVSATATGTYQVDLQGRGGCDSSFTINLTVNTSYSGTVSQVICQGQVYTLPDGRLVSLPGSYLSSFLTPYGCDSIILTNLQVVPPSTWNQSIDLCLGQLYLLPDGTPVDTDGVYQSVVADEDGCDSLIFTFITTVGFQPQTILGPPVTNHWSTDNYSVNYVAGHFYYWTAIGGQIISGQGTNSVQVVWNVSGPDTLILHQYDTQCSYDDTLVVDAIFTSVAVPGVERSLTAFPVPFTDRLMVTWPAELHPESVVLYDFSGRMVLEQRTPELSGVELSTGDLAPGCYLIGFRGAVATMIRVVKQ